MRFNQAVSSLQKSPCLLCSNWFNWFCNPSCSAVFSAPWCRLYTVPSIRRGAAWMARAGVTSLGNHCQPPWESWKWAICQARWVSKCIQPPSRHETVQTTNCRHSQASTARNQLHSTLKYILIRPVNILWIVSKKGHSTAMICHVTTISTNTFGLWPSVVCTWQLAAGNFARHQLPRSPLIEEPTVSAIDVASLTSLNCCQRLIKPNWSVTNMRNWIKPSQQWSAEI